MITGEQGKQAVPRILETKPREATQWKHARRGEKSFG
jgi:hypothetical protein